MMGSSIPFRSHWPKVGVDSHGRFLNVTPVTAGQYDMGCPISHKPAYGKKAPIHPPRHRFMKEKYFPHGSQAFLTLLAQYEARSMVQAGLECVGTHIPSPAEQRALEEARQQTGAGPSSAAATGKVAEQAPGAEPASQGGREEAAQDGQGAAAAQAPEDQQAVTVQAPDYCVTRDLRHCLRATGGFAFGSSICPDTTKSLTPGFQPQCPCEMITLTYCPCKKLKEGELATAPGQDQQETEPTEPAEQADTAPAEPAEDTGTAPAESAEQTDTVLPEAAEQIDTAPTEPAEEPDVASSEPAEEADTAPAEPTEEVEAALAEPAEEADAAPAEPAEEVETAPAEPAEEAETAPAEPAEEADTALTEPAEEADTAPPEPAEEVDTAPIEPTETLENSPSQLAEEPEASANEPAEN